MMNRILLALVLITVLPQSGYTQNSLNGDSNKPTIKIDEEATKEGETDLSKLKEKFAQAQPEDITSENFPEIIESFDFPNAEIGDVIKAISELTGRNFIVDQNVKGKVTIIAPSKITVAEAYKAFLSSLASLGYTVVPSGKFWKIKQSRAAQRDSIETYAGAYFPNADQMITRIIKLRFISAAQVEKDLRVLPSKDGEMRAYDPTNSLIVTDYGSNIARIVKIINELDVPGFEERLAVVPIRFAKAKEIADLIDQIINKEKKGSSRGRLSASRFSTKPKSETAGGQESFSLVIPDDRTNSVIVVGNQAGIKKIRDLVAKLDFKLKPEDSGGVYVYYVKHGDAEEIAKTLNGIAKEVEAQKNKDNPNSSRRSSIIRREDDSIDEASGQAGAIFGGDVKIASDKQTNSLIVTASKQDYDVVKGLLGKIDIPRDQVYVKAVILEMSATDSFDYSIDYLKFDESSGGVGRVGFRSQKSLAQILSPANDSGLVLAFGGGGTVQLSSAAGGQEVSSLAGLVNFLQTNTGANILSTPQLMSLNNEEAEIEVGADVPIGFESTASATGGSSQNIQRTNATIKLKITPYISPDSDTVRMKIEQSIKRPIVSSVTATQLAQSSISISTRSVKTVVTAENGDTVVLGGLIEDKEEENISKIPVLGDIPLLGWLFKARKISKQKSNLLIFITPKIIRSLQDAGDILTQKFNERIDFIQKYMRGRDPHGYIVDNLPQKASLDAGEDKAPEEPAAETF